MSDKPRKKYYQGRLELAVYENYINGEKINKFSIQKNYKDKDDKWQNTKSFDKNDLPNIVFLAAAYVIGDILSRVKINGERN